MDKWALSFHEKLKQYDLGEGHPFRGDRFANAMQLFREQGLLDSPALVPLRPVLPSKEDLMRVHDEGYVDLIFRLAKERRRYDVETPVTPEILEAALLIVGGAIECGKALFCTDVKRAVSVGGGHHHAGRRYGGGFCLFNDVAVLTEYLRSTHGLSRFLILDYDVHFGNGTSSIYYGDDTVLYVSLHQDPRTIYPGTGFTWQIGEGSGEGYNVNVPLPPGTGDDTYLYALEETFVPLAGEFKPQVIIANGGSDSHFADMLGNLALTVQGYLRLARTIKETADRTCGGKLVLIPGSGYNPEVLPRCWLALVAGAIGMEKVEVADPHAPREHPGCRRAVEKTIDELKTLLRRHWSCFGGFSISGVQ